MLKNYFKTAWRHLLNNKAHSLINIGGLSVGLACSLLLFLWVQHELHVDGFHEKGDRLYKVYEREYYSTHVDGNYDMPGLLAEELKKKIPEVEDAAMMQESNHLTTLMAGEKKLKVEGTAATPSLLTMFSYPLLYGNVRLALGSTESIAISRKTATLLFGDAQQAMGKTIHFDDRRDYMVSAVFEDLPATSSRRFDYLISWDSWIIDNPWLKDWGNTGPLAFVLLRRNADIALVNKKLTEVYANIYGGFKPGYHVDIALQPYEEVYLHNVFKDGYLSGGRIEYVYLFAIVAVFLLVIACINFMNLTTARSVKRAKEVGVRKAAGALRPALIMQFMSESLLLTTCAVIIALLLTTLALPVFNRLAQLDIELPLTDLAFWLTLLMVTLVTGVLAGAYPALFLSSFNPVKVLKGATKLSIGALWFRKGLVVFQFTLSIILITGTIVVSKQVHFIMNRNIGYDRDNLVYIPAEGRLSTKFATFKERILQLSGVENVSYVSDNPSNLDQQTTGVEWEGKAPDAVVSIEKPDVGFQFIETMKLQLAEGRAFSESFPTDSNAYMINETAARLMGYDHPTDHTITMFGSKGPIIGVLKDFHFRSLQESIQPLVMRLQRGNVRGEIIVRIKAGQTKTVMTQLGTICQTLNPAFPFSWSFSDEEYEQLYRSEELAGTLSTAFAFLAIFISCLGLLGLVIFSAGQRTREIGIRKVLGASVVSVVRLLTADLLRLVILSVVIAIPASWWAMHHWLNNYAYKTNLNWWIFGLSGGLALLIAISTISFHAFKAAITNPVTSLKHE